MVLMEQYTQKRKNKMKLLLLAIAVFVINSSPTWAQQCIDTVRIKGYFIVIRLKNEVDKFEVTQKTTSEKVIHQRIDVHSFSTFIPFDSIYEEKTLGYRLKHLWDDTKQVFISCEKVDLKYLTYCTVIDTAKSACSFPDFKADLFYYNTDINGSEMYEVYFIDACWAKLKVKKGSIQHIRIPSRIAETSITEKEFDLYYFLKSIKVDYNPVVKDPKISIWKKSHPVP